VPSFPAGEESRKQWIAYYVSTGMHEQARELGWDGEAVERVETRPPQGDGLHGNAALAKPEPANETAPQQRSATKIQSIFRGKSVRDQKEEASRLEWIKFYRETGQHDRARELGWEPEADEAAVMPPFAAPNAGISRPPVANLSIAPESSEPRHYSSTDHNSSRGASPRKSPRSMYGSTMRGWFSSLFGAHNDYDDPTLEYDGTQVTGISTHQAATIMQAAARRRAARLQVVSELKRLRLLKLKTSVETRAAITIQSAWRHLRVKRIEESAMLNARETRSQARADEVTAIQAIESRMEPTSLIDGMNRNMLMEESTLKQLQGVMWKRAAAFPRYQPRYVFVSRMKDGNLALCYRAGDEDGSGDGDLRAIPIATITSVSVIDDVRYEFVVATTGQRAKYRFRVDKVEKLEMWTNGLNFLRGGQLGGRAS